MDKRVNRPVRFDFKDKGEMMDIYYRIEFKVFIEKLLYAHKLEKNNEEYE